MFYLDIPLVSKPAPILLPPINPDLMNQLRLPHKHILEPGVLQSGYQICATFLVLLTGKRQPYHTKYITKERHDLSRAQTCHCKDSAGLQYRTRRICQKERQKYAPTVTE